MKSTNTIKYHWDGTLTRHLDKNETLLNGIGIPLPLILYKIFEIYATTHWTIWLSISLTFVLFTISSFRFILPAIWWRTQLIKAYKEANGNEEAVFKGNRNVDNVVFIADCVRVVCMYFAYLSILYFYFFL